MIPVILSPAAPSSQDFLWILPGHGRRVRFASAAERRERLGAAADAFAADPMGRDAPGPVFHVQREAAQP